MGSQWLAMIGTGHQGKSMWTLGILLLGLVSAQQTLSNEVGVEAGGYAVDPNDPSGYYSGQYASSGPGTDFYSQYPSDGVQSVQTASDTDRITPEIFNDASLSLLCSSPLVQPFLVLSWHLYSDWSWMLLQEYRQICLPLTFLPSLFPE